MSAPALTAEGLHTFYGKSHILHDVGLAVAEGKITALLGRNGAGKTTTLRSLMGLTPPRAGRVTIFGTETTRWPPYRIAAAGVGYVPEGRRIFPNLSVDENLKVPLERAGSWTTARIYQLFPRLAERKQNRGRQLSGGEQEMLSIGRALLLNPKLLILDEPSQGLAPLIVREVFRVVAQMRDEGISVLLVEQNARMSLEIADYAYVLDNGSIVYAGARARACRRRSARAVARRRQRRGVDGSLARRSKDAARSLPYGSDICCRTATLSRISGAFGSASIDGDSVTIKSSRLLTLRARALNDAWSASPPRLMAVLLVPPRADRGRDAFGLRRCRARVRTSGRHTGGCSLPIQPVAIPAPPAQSRHARRARSVLRPASRAGWHAPA